MKVFLTARHQKMRWKCVSCVWERPPCAKGRVKGRRGLRRGFEGKLQFSCFLKKKDEHQLESTVGRMHIRKTLPHKSATSGVGPSTRAETARKLTRTRLQICATNGVATCRTRCPEGEGQEAPLWRLARTEARKVTASSLQQPSVSTRLPSNGNSPHWQVRRTFVPFRREPSPPRPRSRWRPSGTHGRQM